MSLEPSGGFAHLINVVSVEVTLPYEIIPGYHLVRANQECAGRIHDFISTANPSSYFKLSKFEADKISHPQGGATYNPLPKNQHKYFGIEFKGSNSGVTGLAEAADVLGTDLFQFGVVLLNIGSGQGRMWNSIPLTYAIEAGLELKIVAGDLIALRDIHGQLAAHDHNLFDLKYALRQLFELRSIEPSSKLRFLGYFALLESILTHLPKPSDPYESITRQVTNKMVLIGNRMAFHDEYARHFGQLTPTKAWSKLYGYRSAIAHGSPVAFSKGGDFEVLVNHQNALSFLMDATSCILRLALKDPGLIRDLQKC